MSCSNMNSAPITPVYPPSRKAAAVKLCNVLWVCAMAAFMPFRIEAKNNELEELKAMIKKMEQQHQQEIVELRKQIDQLSKKPPPPGPKTGLDVTKDFYDRLQKLEHEVRQAPKHKDGEPGFISPKNWQVNLGGELEFEFVKTEDGIGVSDPDPRFQIDQFYLYPTAKYKDLAFFSADIAIKTSDTQTALLEEGWVKMNGIPFNTYVELGINDLFIANIQRKAETEILVENAFYRDDDVGVRVGGKPLDWLYWEAGAGNGFRLGTRFASEDPSFPMIADRRNVGNSANRPYLGLAVGFNPNLGEYGKIDFLPFYYNGVLDEADIAFLQAIPGYGATNIANNKERYGFNLRYDYGNFTVLGQWLSAQDGTLNRLGWFIQPSYLVYSNPNWQWFNTYELMYRYNNLELDIPSVFDNSLTWDRQQHVLALLVNVLDKTSLKFEYIINNENTGGPDVDNNEFLIQAEIIW